MLRQLTFLHSLTMRSHQPKNMAGRGLWRCEADGLQALIRTSEPVLQVNPVRDTEIQYELSGFQPAVTGCYDDCGPGRRAVDSDDGQFHDIHGLTETNNESRRISLEEDANPR
jgi:hypothetical protein